METKCIFCGSKDTVIDGHTEDDENIFYCYECGRSFKTKEGK